jgi:hypothetical protein
MAEEEEYKKETFDNDDTITWEEYKKTLDKANLTTLETPKIAHKKESFE